MSMFDENVMSYAECLVKSCLISEYIQSVSMQCALESLDTVVKLTNISMINRQQITGHVEITRL